MIQADVHVRLKVKVITAVKAIGVLEPILHGSVIAAIEPDEPIDREIRLITLVMVGLVDQTTAIRP